MLFLVSLRASRTEFQKDAPPNSNNYSSNARAAESNNRTKALEKERGSGFQGSFRQNGAVLRA